MQSVSDLPAMQDVSCPPGPSRRAHFTRGIRGVSKNTAGNDKPFIMGHPVHERHANPKFFFFLCLTFFYLLVISHHTWVYVDLWGLAPFENH